MAKKPKKAVLIFDIGKTNKKMIAFDKRWQILEQKQRKISEKADDDGDACDDIDAIEEWIFRAVKQSLASNKYQVTDVNFSSYGASFVHLDRHMRRIGCLYDYNKEFPYSLYKQFKEAYIGDGKIFQETGSPGVGLINSGFQLYWLKYRKPEFYRQIRYSLHLPQYLSFLFSGLLYSDLSSTGCHTGIWNFGEKSYHKWFVREGLDSKLPPIVGSPVVIRKQIFNHKVNIGLGIHDSTASLIPYLKGLKGTFLMLSTGTWCVSLNPFSQLPLSIHDIAQGCNYYMSNDGKPTKAHRLFLGGEYNYQLKRLASFYRKDEKELLKIKFDDQLFRKLVRNSESNFEFKYLENAKKTGPAKNTDLTAIGCEEAYHCLNIEIGRRQISSLKLVDQEKKVHKIVIDGGFTRNEFFLKTLVHLLPEHQIYVSKAAIGTAIGAAIMMKPDQWSESHFKSIINLKKVKA